MPLAAFYFGRNICGTAASGIVIIIVMIFRLVIFTGTVWHGRPCPRETEAPPNVKPRASRKSHAACIHSDRGRIAYAQGFYSWVLDFPHLSSGVTCLCSCVHDGWLSRALLMVDQGCGKLCVGLTWVCVLY